MPLIQHPDANELRVHTFPEEAKLPNPHQNSPLHVPHGSKYHSSYHEAMQIHDPREQINKLSPQANYITEIFGHTNQFSDAFLHFSDN